MPKVDFEKPISVQSALESLTLALALVMTALRDHAAFETPPDPSRLTWPMILGAAYASTIPVCFGYWAWFRLVEVLPATIASIATLATPVIGVLSGALLLGETVGWREIVSLGLVIVSLVLVLYRKPKE